MTALDKEIEDIVTTFNQSKETDDHASLLAINSLTDLAEKYPWKGQIFTARASVHAESGNFEKAIEDVDAAADLKEMNPNNFSVKIKCLTKMDDLEGIIDTAEKALQHFPEASHFHFAKGYSFDKLARYREAIASYTESINLNPKHLDSYLCLGLLLIQDNNSGAALKTLTNAMELDNQNQNLYLLRAFSLIQTNKPRWAINVMDNMTRMLKKNEILLEDPLTYYANYGHANKMVNNKERALEYFKELQGHLEARSPESRGKPYYLHAIRMEQAMKDMGKPATSYSEDALKSNILNAHEISILKKGKIIHYHGPEKGTLH